MHRLAGIWNSLYPDTFLFDSGKRFPADLTRQIGRVRHFRLFAQKNHARLIYHVYLDSYKYICQQGKLLTVSESE
jgi:hypothetical protein